MRDLNTAKDQFVSSISHELRTPLSAIVGLSATLIDPEFPLDDTERAELLSTIATQSRDMAGIVEDLLVIARADLDLITVSPIVLDVRGAIAEVVELTDVRVECTHGEPVLALADPLRLRQILRNLVTNAERHGGEEIVLRCSTSGSSTCIEVTDSGDGVEPEKIEAIFDPYFSAHPEAAVPSIGVGLAVANKLAALMGGSIEYRRAGGWTTFALSLPASEADVS